MGSWTDTRHVGECGYTKLYHFGARGRIRDLTGLFKPPAHILKSIKLGLDRANSRELLGAGHASEAPESDALPDLPAGDAGPVGKQVCVCVCWARGCERTCVFACMREYCCVQIYRAMCVCMRACVVCFCVCVCVCVRVGGLGARRKKRRSGVVR
jgi:hypothetical protein